MAAALDVAEAVALTIAVDAVSTDVAVALAVVLSVAVTVDMALVVAAVLVMMCHGHGGHEGVFFLVVLFCAQPLSRHCARPIPRQRSSAAEAAGR